MPNTQYAVIHIEKGRGNDTAMSCHIERKTASGKDFIPENADPSRTGLNRELIKFPQSVRNRSAAIQYRIKEAGITRKVAKNQVQNMRLVLTGSHDQMWKLVETGRLEDWIKANLKWLNDTYGKDNVVSCVLHMDEKTPHLHATVVPITFAPRKRREREGERKYAEKVGPRLSVSDYMTRAKLREYQTSYAIAMKPFGLARGIVGSDAKHVSVQEYNASLIRKQEQKIISLEKKISKLANEIEEVEKAKAEAKESAVARVCSWLGGGKLEKERESGRQKDQRILDLESQLQQEKDKLTELKKASKAEMNSMKVDYMDEIDRMIQEAENASRKTRNLKGANRTIYRNGREMHRQLYPERYKLSSGAEIVDFEFDEDPESSNSTEFKIKTKVGNALNELWFSCNSNVVNKLNSFDMTLEELVNQAFRDPMRQLCKEQIDTMVDAGLILIDEIGGHYFSSSGGVSHSDLPWNDKDKRKGRRR